MSKVLESTIALPGFSLGDWLQIASFCGFKPQWALNCWLESTPSDVLGGFDLEVWEAIAQSLDYNDGWAYHRFKEYRIKK